ncbi:1899_t:CDS:2, partial [Gigaspora margarita]
MSPSRRNKNIYSVEKTSGNRFKCPSPECHCLFAKYEKLENHIQDIHITTVREIRLNQFARQIQLNNDSNTFSFKNNMRKQLDEIYNKLEVAKNKYLPLIEYGYPRISEFSQCCDSITLLKVEISGFNKKQIHYVNSILDHKVAVVPLIATLLYHSLTNKIKELKEKYRKLNMKYHTLKKDHNTGDDYYTESQHLLESENANLEFFEEIEATKLRNSELENDLHLLHKQNVKLSKEIEELANKRATLSE